MGQIQYSFDPTRGVYELRDLFELLNKYYPDLIPADIQKLRSNSSHNPDYDKKIKELNDVIKKHQEENIKKEGKISELEKQLEETRGYLQMAEEDLKKAKENNERQIAIHTEKETKLQEDFMVKLNQIKEEKSKEILKLEKQVAELIKKLSAYEPTLEGDTGEQKYFQIEGINLSETFDDTAPFVGKLDAAGNAIFNFNVEKGQHKYYSQNSAELSDFCEIIDYIDGANHIGLGEWGKGKYNRGLLVVTTKAKIKLTRE